MAEWIFFLSLALLIYTYAGYPLLLYFFSLYKNQTVKLGNTEPDVSIIIPVHNEERQIGAKIKNCLDFDYPCEKLKILVVSDSSTDKTEEIVKSFKSDQIQFLQLPFRGGKVAAQNYAVRFCDSEIIIFTDVAIMTSPDCVKFIVQNFHDLSIGVVSCRDVVIGERTQPRGESSYIRYDMMVRKFTSRIGSLIGVTGGFYAVRKEIAAGGWNPAFPPDFYVAIRSIKRGLRVIEDQRVKAYYKTAAKEWDELKRKVRTLNRGIHAFFAVSNRNLLNPLDHGIISWQLISHKLFRWLTPFFLLALFISNGMLLEDKSYAVYPFYPQIILYVVGMLAYLFRNRIEKNVFLRIILYFVVTNLSLLKAWYEFIIGKKYMLWQPTKR